MTARQRFLATLRDGASGCAPHHERTVREDVIAGWREQGLDEAAAEALLAYDRWQTGGYAGPPGIDLLARPPLEHALRTLEDVPGWYARFQPGQRFSSTWEADVAAVQQRDWPLGFHVSRGLLLTLGISDASSLTDALYFLADHGGEVEAMMAHLANLTVPLLERAIAETQPDYLVCSEPIASNHGPVIGPAMLRRFCLPLYQRLLAVARAGGVGVLVWESYGQVEPLLPVVLEAGFNTLWIGQAGAAGVSYQRLRERYGPDLGLIGGIDARCLFAGDDAIRRTVCEAAGPLLAAGRYAPMLDERVRPNVPYAAFRTYQDSLRELLGRSW